jgi:hypothetical protein
MTFGASFFGRFSDAHHSFESSYFFAITPPKPSTALVLISADAS